ncbi:MAG: hypothetical protein AAB308_12650, partial [Nitrospirota bacterium]
MSDARTTLAGFCNILVLCLVSSLMTACAPPSQIPPYFETLERTPIERIPINTVLVHGQRIA